MTDLVFLTLRSGDGGNGRVSFRREKFIPKGGPDGGDGGNGGHVIVRASDSATTLQWYAGKTNFSATAGGLGGRRNKTGTQGESVTLEVPIGTIIWQLQENYPAHTRRLMNGCDEPLAREKIERVQYHLEREGGSIPERLPDLLYDAAVMPEAKQATRFEPEKNGYVKLWEAVTVGEEFLICQGGIGGRGNDRFKSSVEQVPLRAEYGTPGELRDVAFELRLLADIGLVGLPNAGKSTLLSIVTQARPKIAAYPFTTLEPHLGVMHDPSSQRELVMADIPGLIEGASEGKGLGFSFLRHVSNCRGLVFILTLEETVVFDEAISAEQKAELVWKQYLLLLEELRAFDVRLLQKKQRIALSKSDLYSPEVIEQILKLFAANGQAVIPFSAITGQGMDELKTEVFELAQ